MTTTVIEPQTFDFLLCLIIFVMGLDFIWSGYLVIRNKNPEIKKRRLLGLWVIRKLHIPDNKKNEYHSLVSLLYNFRNMGFMTLAGGLLITIGSIIMIVGFLL